MTPKRLRSPLQAPPRHRGAALVEFIVIATFVLVPLYLATQAIAKFADVRSAALNAARYAAWEHTVWNDAPGATSDFATRNQPNRKDSDAILNEVRTRLLNSRQPGFKYKDTDRAQTTLANGIDPMWHDTGGNALVTDPTCVTLATVEQKPAKDILGAALSLINAISVPSVTGTLAPPVPTDTMAVATLGLNRVGADSDVYKRLWSKAAGLPEDWAGLDFTASSAILGNTWAANASGGTKAMVASSVPTANGLGTAVSVATKAVMLAWDPLEFPRLDLGKIAPDVVPEDRLK